MTKQEMPARIWAYPQDEQSIRGRWHNVPVQHADAAEYRRADLPPTPAEAMRCPEVMALVEEMRSASSSLEAIALHSPSKGSSVVAEAAWRRSLAALSALEQAVRHE